MTRVSLSKNFLCLFTCAVIGLLSTCTIYAKETPSLYAIEKLVFDIHVNEDVTSTQITEQTTLIKDQLMIDTLANEEISFNSAQETVEIIEAYTLLPSGEKIFVKPDAIRTVDSDKSSNASYFSDYKDKVIVFPNVVVGARLYYKMLATRHTPVLPGVFTDRTHFSPTVAYEDVEIRLSHAPALKIYVDSRGIPGGLIEKGSDQSVRYRYTFKQPIVLESEGGELSALDTAPYVLFSNLPDMVSVGDITENLSKEKIAPTPKVKQLADDITQGITDPKEQARALYNWVARNIRYIAIFVGHGGYVPHAVDTIIDNRYGDCKDHNALLISLLAAKGILASSATISTVAFDLPKIGSLTPFNHVITYIPQWDLYVDSTSDLAPFGIISSTLAGKPTILTALNKIGRTPSLQSQENFKKTQAQYSVSQTGEISAEAMTRYGGFLDLGARYKFVNYVGQYKENKEKNHLHLFNEIGTGKYSPTDVYDLNTPITIKSEFKLEPTALFPGPGAMTIPVGLAPGDITLRSYSPLLADSSRPFKCASYYYEEKSDIKFADGITITAIPKDMHIQAGPLSYTSTYSRKEQTVYVKRVLTANQEKAFCQPEQIEQFRQLNKTIRRDVLGQIFYK